MSSPPGVDLKRFHPLDKRASKRRVGIPCGDNNILFAGRIEPLKGIDTLLCAMSILQERHPDAVRNTCVAIIGGDPWADDLDAEMARLQQLRRDLGIHDLVTFLGAKDQDVLPYYYAAAEMVVMPSHYESFGMVALEAMAMGTGDRFEVGGLATVQNGYNGYHALATRNLAARILNCCKMLTRVFARPGNTPRRTRDHIVRSMLTVTANLLLCASRCVDASRFTRPVRPCRHVVQRMHADRPGPGYVPGGAMTKTASSGATPSRPASADGKSGFITRSRRSRRSGRTHPPPGRLW